jgi:hypothetical protein
MVKLKVHKTLIARIISRLFDPIWILPLLLAISAWSAFVSGERVRFISFLVLLDAILPGLVLFYFVKRHKVISGWDVDKRKERIPLFIFVVACHLGGVMAAWFLGKHPLAEYLTSFWILAIVFAVITAYWKISIHVGVMSALISFLILTHGYFYAILYLCLAFVAWSRVTLKHHSMAQVVAGGLVPAIVLPVCFAWFGI